MGDSSPIPPIKEGMRFEHFQVLHQQYRLPEELGLKTIRQKNNPRSSQTHEWPEFRNLKKKKNSSTFSSI